MLPPFFRPTLRGERFSSHEVPLEVFKDFVALQEMLIEVAKREYLDANPGRQRTPRGFTKGIEVRLASIEDGSAVLTLALAGLSALFPESTYIAKASEKILNTIASIERGEKPELPPDLLRYFDRFGRSLLPGESIDFTYPQGGTTSLTPEVRLELLRASQAEEWTMEGILKGRISAANKSEQNFEMELKSGVKLKGPLEQHHGKTIIDALAGYERRQMVAVKGIIKIDRTSMPKSFESVEQVNQLDPLDIGMRLEDLSGLNGGWLNGRGAAIDKAVLQTLTEQFDDFFDSKLPLPHLYPTPEGGILAEWVIADWSVSLDIDIPSLAAQYQALNLLSDACQEETLDLREGQSGWTRLNAALRDLNLSSQA